MSPKAIDEKLVRAAPKSVNALKALLFDGLDWPKPIFANLENIPLIDWEPGELHLDEGALAKLSKIQQVPKLNDEQPFGVFILSFEGGRLPIGAVRRVVDRLVHKKRAQKNMPKALWGLSDLLFFCLSDEGVATLHVVAFHDSGEAGKVPVMKVISWSSDATDNRISLVASENLPELVWPSDSRDADAWRAAWTGAFTATYRQGVKSSAALAARMADVARTVRDEVSALLAVETGAGPLRRLLAEVRTSLRGDMSEDEFADMYAQTMVYGLLASRITYPEDFDADAVSAVLRFDNEFLDALYKSFRSTGNEAFDVDAFGLRDLGELLARTDVDEILADVGTDEYRDDPVVFFYEEFLARYDDKQRKELGTYYTPVPVVRFMVRAVDEIIKTDFGLPLGVADQTTWGEYSKAQDIPIPEALSADTKVIRMLDPATGTGTYLLEWMRKAEANLRSAQQYSADAMRAVVEQMDAFEISLSSFAVAHLKTSLELEPGLRADAKIGIRLTDTLAGRASSQMAMFGGDPIAREGALAEAAKFVKRHSVVIGNPPYMRTSRDAGGGWLVQPEDGETALFDQYLERALRKTAFGHTRSLFNLYTFFMRFAHWKAFEQGEGPGVVAFITASSWLTGPGFLGIRELAREACDEILVVDVGGDNLGTRPEENIFPIQIPVAITFLVRRGAKRRTDRPAEVRYTRIEGTRLEKLAALSDLSLRGPEWIDVAGDLHSSLTPVTGAEEWGSWPLLEDLLPLQQPGCKWARTWPHSTQVSTLQERWELFLSDASLEWRERAFVTAKTGRKPTTQVGSKPRLADLPAGTPAPAVTRYAYRSFDRQWAFADERMSDGYRPSLWASLSERQVFMTTTITGKLGNGPGATVATAVPDYHHFNGRGGKDVVPLYRDSSGAPNIDTALLSAFEEAGLVAVPFQAEDLFAYCYGVLAGADYTSRFREELETPGPRIPMTRDPELFAEMAAHGGQLLWLQTFGERFREGDRRALKSEPSIRWTKKPSRIPADSKDFAYVPDREVLLVADGELAGVSPPAWAFEVSGMRVLKKWLGYRTAKGAGRAASSGSPLDRIRPSAWEPEWSDELRDLVHVLSETERLIPVGVKLLDRIVDGEMIAADEIPEPPAALRKPPKVARAGDDELDLED